MCWADRLAIFWAMLLIVAILILQPPGGFAISISPENIIDSWGALLGKLVLIPWLVLRVIDLLLGGPRARSFKLPYDR